MNFKKHGKRWSQVLRWVVAVSLPVWLPFYLLFMVSQEPHDESLDYLKQIIN